MLGTTRFLPTTGRTRDLHLLDMYAARRTLRRRYPVLPAISFLSPAYVFHRLYLYYGVTGSESGSGSGSTGSGSAVPPLNKSARI